jgi:hypothetical protein
MIGVHIDAGNVINGTALYVAAAPGPTWPLESALRNVQFLLEVRTARVLFTVVTANARCLARTQNGADPNARGWYGQTACFVARHKELLELLVLNLPGVSR